MSRNNAKTGNPGDPRSKSILETGPLSSSRTIMFHQAIADHLGLNPTDHKCLLFLMDGRKTAGQMAEMTGLTTGAVTSVLDRLENAGYVRRVHDTEDRRRVFAEIVPENAREIGKLFQPLARAMSRLEASYSKKELAVIEDFLNRSSDILFKETVRIRKIKESSGS